MGLSLATEVYTRLGGAVGMTVRAVGYAKRFLGKTTARPGIGSAVTKGPLKVGKQVVYGKAGMSTAAKVAGAIGAGGVGLGTVASHRAGGVQKNPSTKSRGRAASAAQSQPSPRRSSPASTSTDRKLCCPKGTKRKVCFKRDVDEVAEAKRKARKRKAKARAIKRGRKSARKRKAKRKTRR